MVRRIGLFALALVLALFGTGLVYVYADGAEARAMAGQDPVQVLVAVAALPAGSPASAAVADGRVELRALPSRAVPAGALRNLDDMGGRVAASEIFPGEVLLPGRFVDPSVAGALSIPPGMLASSVELTDPGRVACFVVPGSEVSIYASFSTKVAGADDMQVTGLLLPRVKVLAAGPTSLRGRAPTSDAEQDAPEAPVPTSVLTVAVDQAGAAKLVHAAEIGIVSFALLTANSETGGTTGLDTTKLFT